MHASRAAHVASFLLVAAYLCTADVAVANQSNPPVVTRLDALRALRAREFGRLEQALVSLQTAAEKDPSQETALMRVLRAFDTADPAVTPLVDAWVESMPASLAARLARATHQMALGWHARGFDWSDNTSAEQKQEMTAHLEIAARDAAFVVSKRGPDAQTAAVLIRATKGLNGADGCIEVAGWFSEIVERSLTASMNLAQCLLPRWGGSYPALETLAGETGDHVALNPSLAALGGVVAWDRATRVHDSDAAQAIPLYSAAIAAGDHVLFRTSRARAYRDRRRYSEAMVDLNRALELAPEDSETLMLQAYTLNDLGRGAEAAARVRAMRELEPLYYLFVEFRDDELERAVNTGRRRYNEGDVPGAIERLTEAIDLVEGDAEVYYWRGRARLKGEDRVGAVADFDRAVKLDPRHFEALQGLDYILVERGQYKSVVEYWTAYLALEPDNGKALLSRAKAHIGRGDVTPGVADASAACKAGLQEGCALATIEP